MEIAFTLPRTCSERAGVVRGVQGLGLLPAHLCRRRVYCMHLYICTWQRFWEGTAGQKEQPERGDIYRAAGQSCAGKPPGSKLAWAGRTRLLRLPPQQTKQPGPAATAQRRASWARQGTPAFGGAPAPRCWRSCRGTPSGVAGSARSQSPCSPPGSLSPTCGPAATGERDAGEEGGVSMNGRLSARSKQRQA